MLYVFLFFTMSEFHVGLMSESAVGSTSESDGVSTSEPDVRLTLFFYVVLYIKSNMFTTLNNVSVPAGIM